MLRRAIPGLPAIVALGAAAQAQTYPSRPIRLVVGYTPGGGNDLIARIVAPRLQDRLGQPVVVDNKPGAQSIVAAELVAKSAPDGYTLLVAPSGPMTINLAVPANLPYAPERDFVPISLLAEFPLLLAVGAEQPVKSVRELVEHGRANPSLANYASSATPFLLAAELLNLAEAGAPGMEISLWTGIVAPAGTPPDVMALLQMAVAGIAVDPRCTTSDEYRALIVRDTARWKAVTAAANIKPE